MPVPSKTPWTSSGAALTETRHRSSRPAVPRRADSATKRPPATSASTSALPRRWPIFRSAAGKRASSASCTARGVTPSNSSPSRKSSLNGGRARIHASSELARCETRVFELGLRRRRTRRRALRCGRVPVIEIYLRRLPRAFFGFEVGIVARETAQTRHETVWKESEEGVVVLHGFVVTPPLHGDAVLRARQLILEPQEVLVGFQLRIVLHDHEQTAKSGIKLYIGGNLLRRRMRGKQGGARLGNFAEDYLLLHRDALHRLHQVGNQIRAALQHDIHLRPRRIHRFALHRHLISAVDERTAEQQSHQCQNEQDH